MTEKEEEFSVKRHFQWFDQTKAMIELTPDSNLGWVVQDMNILSMIARMKGTGGKLDMDSALASRFNRDGSLCESKGKRD